MVAIKITVCVDNRECVCVEKMQLWYRRPVSPAAAAAEPASENLRSQSTTRQTKSAEMELDL